MKKIYLGSGNKWHPVKTNIATLIDDEDYDRVVKYKWHLSKRNNLKYAVSSRGTNNYIKLHRLILDAKENQLIDHINGNGLDNRKENLRFCSSVQNQMNTKIRKDNTSGHRGVMWNKRDKKWRAVIRINKKQTLIGKSYSKLEAIKMYDKKAKELYGEFVRQN